MNILSSNPHVFLMQDDYLRLTRVKKIIQIFRKHDILHGMTPEKMRMILEDMGPIFIKLGQILSMRPDFLDISYCDELKKLQTLAKPLPFADVKKVLQAEYHQDSSKIFSWIDEHPLGSASMAQVHIAKLVSGEDVVIKILRPDIDEDIAQDILLLKRLTKAVLSFSRKENQVVDFMAVLDEMWAIARQEMDLLLEADHMDRFLKLNANDKKISCPRVFRLLTTSKVLVMDYIDGEFLTNTSFLGEILAKNYVKQILDDGYFHADPHFGNLRLKNNQIFWLDFGMMGRLSFHDRNALRQIVIAFSMNDDLKLKSAILSLSDPDAKINQELFLRDVHELLEHYRLMDFKNLQMGELTRDIVHLLRNHKLKIAPQLSILAKSLLTFEGLLRQVFPQIRLIEIFTQHLEISFEKNFDWQKVKRDGYIFFTKTMRLPDLLADMLKMTMHGETKVNLELTGSEEPLNRIDFMINKIILGMISSALLLGSSVICMTNMSPKFLEIPLVGVVGYFVAFLIGLRLLWDIWRQGK